MKISKAEFARRRKKLMGMMDRQSIAIIPGAREVTRSRDTESVSYTHLTLPTICSV